MWVRDVDVWRDAIDEEELGFAKKRPKVETQRIVTPRIIRALRELFDVAAGYILSNRS